MATTDHLMIDRRILQEAKTLVENGYEVTVLAGFECPSRESYTVDGVRIERFVYEWSDSRFVAFAQRWRLIPGTRIHAILWRLFRLWANRLAGISCFDQFVLDQMLRHEEVDIVHAHDYPVLAAAAEFARRRGIPLVYDAHEIYYAQYQLSSRVRRRIRQREQALLPCAAAVITVNPYIARLMAERYGIPEPWVILNAAPLRRIEKAGEAGGEKAGALRRHFGLGAATRIVLYQGWISEGRGIERLVEAAALLAEGIVLVIVGYGDFAAVLHQRVAELGLEGRVLFYGPATPDELHTLTCDADLGVIPYHGLDENNYFCSPNKLFEFTVAGLPFVCNDLPFLRDITTRHGCGIATDLTTPEAIARAINGVFAAPETLPTLRAGALAAREELNWEMEGRKLMEIYCGLG